MRTDYKTLTTDHREGVALIIVNPPPLNQFSSLLVTEMTEAFQSGFEDDAVRAIVLTGSGRQFIGGQDIREILNITNKDAQLPKTMSDHKFINAIEGGPKPVIAAINGNCSRVGLEIALACHYRLAVEGIRLGMLETRFGLIPGLGGTQRLPRLIGVRQALEMLISAQDIPVRKSLQMGLVDQIVPRDRLIGTAVAVAGEFVSGRLDKDSRIVSRTNDRLPTPREKAEIIRRIKDRIAESNRGYLAPFKVIEAVERGGTADFLNDITLEAHFACDCMVSDTSKNLIRIFLNSRIAGTIPRAAQSAVRNIKTVGVLGCGSIGTGAALLLMKRGFNVRLWDEDERALIKGMEIIKASVNRSVEIGEIPRDIGEKLIRERLFPTLVMAELKDIDLAVEAVAEDMDTKQKTFRRLESVCRSDVIFGSSSAALPITRIASALEVSERMIGLHFLSPVESIQLLEIIVSRATTDEILFSTIHFAKRLGKIPVVVNDGPGFFVTRQQAALLGEACFLVSDGGNPFTIDKAMTDFGLPVGPAQLADMIGIDTVYAVARHLKEALGERWEIPRLYGRFIETGCLGRKSGAGWYDYRSSKPTLNFKFLEAIKKHLSANGLAPRKIPDDEIQERLMARMINEAACCVQDGVSRKIPELDLAAIYGLGFPPYRGGIFRYADAWGVPKVVEYLSDLHIEKGVRFKPADLLVQMAETGKSFYEGP